MQKQLAIPKCDRPTDRPTRQGVESRVRISNDQPTFEVHLFPGFVGDRHTEESVMANVLHVARRDFDEPESLETGETVNLQTRRLDKQILC